MVYREFKSLFFFIIVFANRWLKQAPWRAFTGVAGGGFMGKHRFAVQVLHILHSSLIACANG